MLTLAFHLEGLEGEDDHSLCSSIYGVVAVGVVRVVGWIVWRNHTTAGSCEFCPAPWWTEDISFNIQRKTVSSESGDWKLLLIAVKMQMNHPQRFTFTRCLMWDKMNSEQTQVPNTVRFKHCHSVSRSFDTVAWLPGSYWCWRRLWNLCQGPQCSGIEWWWCYMEQRWGPGPQSRSLSTAEPQYFGSDPTTPAGKFRNSCQMEHCFQDTQRTRLKELCLFQTTIRELTVCIFRAKISKHHVNITSKMKD